jgi:hypothetical protein
MLRAPTAFVFHMFRPGRLVPPILNGDNGSACDAGATPPAGWGIVSPPARLVVEGAGPFVGRLCMRGRIAFDREVTRRRVLANRSLHGLGGRHPEHFHGAGRARNESRRRRNRERWPRYLFPGNR